MSRGGYRPGAGRKAAGELRESMNLRVLPSTKSTIRGIAGEVGISLGQAVDMIVEDYTRLSERLSNRTLDELEQMSL